ncbi:hypothetical protein HYZ41_00460 [archaeon]|nr:hypothetical protein [archaeon]
MIKEKNETEKNHKRNKSASHIIVYGLMAITIFVLVMNQFAISGLETITKNVVVQTATRTASSSLPASDTGTPKAASFSNVLPSGVPPIYGKEMGVSYDDISTDNQQATEATIRKLGSYDTSINLAGEQLQRYIQIAGQISCEYCCGAPSVIFTQDTGKFKAGDAACSCAHSYAMRGVAKYLITKHGNEFSDDQVLEEMAKWKTLFFPAQHTQKADVLKGKNIEVNYINLASNKYRGIEKGSSGGMVGGC